MCPVELNDPTVPDFPENAFHCYQKGVPLLNKSIHKVNTPSNGQATIEFTCTYINIMPRLGLEVYAGGPSGSRKIAEKDGSDALEGVLPGTYTMTLAFNQ